MTRVGQVTTLDGLLGAFESLPDWQGFLAIVLASVAIAFLVQKGGDIAARRVTKRIPGNVDDVVLRTVHPPLYVTVVLGGIYLAVVQFDVVTVLPALTGAESLQGDLRATVYTVLTLLWAVTLIRLGTKVSRELTDGERVESTVVPIFQNVWTAVVLGATFLLLLLYWRIDPTPLLASAGILGIIIGLAARDTIANFFGSIALYLDGTYAVGDFVVLESGVRGRVEDVSIRSTVIRTRDDILITVPNSVLNSAQITNESVPERDRRIRIPLGVAYGSDLDHVEEVLLRVADEDTFVVDQPIPRVRYRGFGDSAIDVELLGWIPDPVLRGRATHELVKSVHEAFVEEGIEIPFPQRDVHVQPTTATERPGADPDPDPVEALGDGGESDDEE